MRGTRSAVGLLSEVLALHGRALWASGALPLSRPMWRVTTDPSARADGAFLVEGGTAPPDFALYLTRRDECGPSGAWLRLPPSLTHLSDGDVLWVSPSGQQISVIWRANAPSNSVLLTEQCDNYCLMCSQPPRQREDRWLLDRARQLVRMLPDNTPEIGFTGGEPTIFGDDFLQLLHLCREQLPTANVHVLSNGRRFSDPDFTASYAQVDNPRMMVGIPVYGAEPTLHDFVVQATGAFDETVRGILNLGRAEQRIELRVVIHKQTAPHLVEIAAFIARNLPFVEQVALMGLEMMGLARANATTVWIDPIEYREELREATMLLHYAGIRTMIYSHQLCLIDSQVWPFAVKSISDWKNEYVDECTECAVSDACGGFFSSAKYKRSAHISPITSSAAAAAPAVLS